MEKNKINRMKFVKVIVLVLATLSVSQAYSNAIALSAISVDRAASTISFTVTWENSWRAAAGTPPFNWDAAWVFVKFRDCADPSSTTQFTHGAISTTVGDHNYDGDAVGGATLEPTTSAGVAGIDGDGKGIMLRPSAVGAGTITETIVLNVTNLPAAGATLDVRVFAIEMVYAAGGADGGSHWIGDGNGVTKSYGSFNSATTAYQISNENAITLVPNPGTTSGSRAVTASFQKGWNPFYIMKYEVSQGQYVNFLNTLNDNSTGSRYPGSYNSYRNRIQWTVNPAPQIYSVDRPDRACNFLGWSDLSAYLDWAALRPLTEIEFEKAARGFLGKSLFEFAWGNVSIVRAVTISGVEDGTETITTANANTVASFTTFNGPGDDGQGPLRVGIFAKAGTTTRVETGGSYFGVMELSGNVQEMYAATPCGIAGAPCENGLSAGDGVLDAAGAHNEATWPSSAAPGTGTSAHIIRRGGSWATSTCATATATCHQELSNRYGGDNASGNNTPGKRDQYTGGRGGR